MADPQLSQASLPPAHPVAATVPITEGQPAAPAIPLIGHKVAGGYVWMTGQAIVTKAISICAQIVLARLLATSDYGLVGLALMVSALAGSVQHAGINEVLIQRFAHWRRWVTPGFWISVTFGLGAALLMCGAAPLVAHRYHDARLVPLILILAGCAPFDAMSMIPSIWLQMRLSFGLLARLEIVRVVMVAGLSILFAWMGMGACSFILPLLIAAILRAAVLWFVARPRVRFNLQFRRWRYILKDSRLLVGISLALTIVAQGDYMILGFLHSKAIVGIYFFAFGLSAQTLSLLVARLSDVLFPVLSHLRLDPPRQTQAFVRAARVLAFIAFPPCLLQSAMAGPILRVVFGRKWDAAIPVFAVLSIGMIASIISSQAWSLLQAQGRFATALRYSLIRAGVFLAAIWIAASLGAALSVAIAVAACLWVTGPCLIYLTVGARGVSAAAIVRMHLLPLGLSLAALAPALLLGWLIRRIGGNDVAFAIVVASCTMVLYIPLLRWTVPQDFADVMARSRSVLSRLRQG